MMFELFHGRVVLDTRHGLSVAAPVLGEVFVGPCGEFVRSSLAEIQEARRRFVERVEQVVGPLTFHI